MNDGTPPKLIRHAAPWRPLDIPDVLMHEPEVPTYRGPMVREDETETVLALAEPYDRVDGVWVDGYRGPIALLWPMDLGHGDDA